MYYIEIHTQTYIDTQVCIFGIIVIDSYWLWSLLN